MQHYICLQVLPGLFIGAVITPLKILAETLIKEELRKDNIE